jgi:hypothetical protein
MRPIRFAFGIHLHQPVGNFDHVFAQHVADVYRPFLERLATRDFFPLCLHLSGPLLEWLETHDQPYLDYLAGLVAAGKVELLLAGMYEPVLASLPRRDRVEQIGWMQEAMARRFGARPTGLWLTERVWEPELAADLADAGVRYALVDDRHFLVTGFRPDQLHRPYLTESDGKVLHLFPIDERLRYLIPFRPPSETAAYLRELRSQGHALAVLADDAEKFGGWPGTKEWVYDRGWLDDFLTSMGHLIEGGEMELTTLSDALSQVPTAGPAYLPTASYREMEGWALPPDAARRLVGLERDLGTERCNGPDGALIRGAHWRNFLVKYAEANRMHKKMQALSAKCRHAGDPTPARRAIGRAQCNDAYWHGVFGGLYLPHLRNAIWRELALAEGTLRQGEGLGFEWLDLDCDGHLELWIHSSSFSALISPTRGGGLEEYTRFAAGINYADVLTRRREVYHQLTAPGPGHQAGDGTPSIHELEGGFRLTEVPPQDPGERVMLADRVLAGDVTFEAYTRGDYRPIWMPGAAVADVGDRGDQLEVRLLVREGEASALEKAYRFSAQGLRAVDYRWDPAVFPARCRFAPELSIAAPLEVTYTPGVEVWSYAIATVAKSERGLEETLQGRSLTPLWPVEVGLARVEFGPER